MSLIKVDLPLPETPVIHVITPIGKFKFTFFKLLPLAFVIEKKESLGLILSFGPSIFFFPLKYCPVRDSLLLFIWFGSPSATITPPCIPAPGPISTT